MFSFFLLQLIDLRLMVVSNSIINQSRNRTIMKYKAETYIIIISNTL